MNARARAAGLMLATVGALTGAGGAAAAAGGCHIASGSFTAVAPATCPSPVGICAHGTLTGGFPATEDLVGDTLTPQPDGTQVLVGHSTITTPQGALLLDSVRSVLRFTSPTTAEFTTVERIVGGTRQYAHASGGFLATATLDFATGLTSGTYAGTICLGNGPH
jgi:hypothetical protein